MVEIRSALDVGQSGHVLTGHTDTVRAIAISADERMIATAGDDKSVRLWDASTGALIWNARDHRETVASLTYLAGGTLA